MTFTGMGVAGGGWGVPGWGWQGPHQDPCVVDLVIANIWWITCYTAVDHLLNSGGSLVTQRWITCYTAVDHLLHSGGSLATQRWAEVQLF
jgi:hypothetical protein